MQIIYSKSNKRRIIRWDNSCRWSWKTFLRVTDNTGAVGRLTHKPATEGYALMGKITL